MFYIRFDVIYDINWEKGVLSNSMAKQMTERVTIKFYWDVGSTNSYFAFHLLRPIAQEFGAVIEYMPFNLGYVFRHHQYVLSEEPKAKLKNRATDLQRWAKKYKLPFNVPEQFPIKTSDALKGSLVMRRLGMEEAYIEKLFSTYWEDNDASIKSLDGLIPLAIELGVTEREFVESLRSEEISEQLISLTQIALANDIFGAPTMVIEDEIYWGKDRFDFIRDHLSALSR